MSKTNRGSFIGFSQPEGGIQKCYESLLKIVPKFRFNTKPIKVN